MINPTDDVNATFTRVAYELHHQYVLGFSPEKLDGKVHAINVRVADSTMIGAGPPELPRDTPRIGPGNTTRTPDR